LRAGWRILFGIKGIRDVVDGTPIACSIRWIHRALGVAAMLACTSCLIAPPIQEDPQENTPFTVDLEQVSPDARTVQYLRLGGDSLTFSVLGAAQDPDGDTLYYYWLLRRDGTEDVEAYPWQLDSASIDPCSPRRAAGSEWLLEVVISDRGLDYPAESWYDFPPEANWQTVAWWWLQVQDGVCP
jgi:hypothetical protein